MFEEAGGVVQSGVVEVDVVVNVQIRRVEVQLSVWTNRNGTVDLDQQSSKDPVAAAAAVVASATEQGRRQTMSESS